VVYTLSQARRRGWRMGERPSLARVAATAREGFWAIMLPVIVLGGIYTGAFTPTEAAAVSVAYALFVEMFIHRELALGDIPAVCKQAAILSSCLLFLLAGAMTFNWLLTAEQVPGRIAELILTHIHSSWTFLLMVNLLLLVLGCFMDTVSAILVLAPLFAETLSGYSIDPVHFGIIMVLNMEFGMLTPPFGLNLFVAMGMTGENMGTVSRGVLPFLVILLICLALVTYVPAISLFLPQLFLR